MEERNRPPTIHDHKCVEIDALFCTTNYYFDATSNVTYCPTFDTIISSCTTIVNYHCHIISAATNLVVCSSVATLATAFSLCHDVIPSPLPRTLLRVPLPPPPRALLVVTPLVVKLTPAIANYHDNLAD